MESGISRRQIPTPVPSGRVHKFPSDSELSFSLLPRAGDTSLQVFLRSPGPVPPPQCKLKLFRIPNQRPAELSLPTQGQVVTPWTSWGQGAGRHPAEDPPLPASSPPALPGSQLAHSSCTQAPRVPAVNHFQRSPRKPASSQHPQLQWSPRCGFLRPPRPGRVEGGRGAP